MIMRDSIDARLIPVDTPAVAGYGDGRFIWSPSWVDGSNWWDRFPNSKHLVIVVNAAHSGDILDVEQGDATPADCPGWADRFNRPARRRPTLYHQRGLRAEVLTAMAGRPYDWWAATLDGTTDVPGAVAVQYVDTGGYDESLIIDPSWVGGDPMDTRLVGDQAAQLEDTWNFLYYGAAPRLASSPPAWINQQFAAIQQQLAHLQADLDALKAQGGPFASAIHRHDATTSGTTGPPLP